MEFKNPVYSDDTGNMVDFQSQVKPGMPWLPNTYIEGHPQNVKGVAEWIDLVRPTIQPYEATEEEIENARAGMLAEVDGAAGRARSRYITTVPGQEATYQMKAAEARRGLQVPPLPTSPCLQLRPRH